MGAEKYFTLHSSLFDLGSFLHNIHNVASGDWMRSFAGHVQPLMFPWSWVYSSLPADLAPYFLLAEQAIVLAIPCWLLWRVYGRLPAIAYALYYPVWVNAHFDFHFDHLAVPFLFMFYLAVRAGKPYLSMVPALLLMGVKEPFALQVVACGLYLILAGLCRPNRVDAGNQLALTTNQSRPFTVSGLMLVGGGAIYFYAATRYMIPYYTGEARVGLNSNAFSWLGQSMGGMVLTLLTHPLEILGEILGAPGKLTYLFVIFGLLAFIPLLAPFYLIPALPLLAIAMLSRLPNYYDYNTHYTAGLIVPVMIAFVHGLPKAHALWTRGAIWVWRKVRPSRFGAHPQGKRETKGATLHAGGRVNGAESAIETRLSKTFYVLLVLWILVGHVLLSPSPISRLFWSDKVWSYSWRAYAPTEREAMMKEAMLKYIPADPEATVTTQNTVNWYYLAHRRVYAAFPHGIEEPIQIMAWQNRTWNGFWSFVQTGEMSTVMTHDRYADYVVLDLKRPWFIVDKGCEWIYGECRDKEKAREFLDLVANTKARYKTLFERDGFMILERR